MPDDSTRKLKLATIIYWILLVYIIVALLWWALALEKQNETMYQLRLEHLNTLVPDHQSVNYTTGLQNIERIRIRNIAMYSGEGGMFLLLILVGAVFIYRSVRRQLRLQQQQQNFVMAVTHELKTPIAVSRLNLETLLRYKLEDAKREKLMHMTLQETLRLDTLINNILISSQLDGRSYRLEKEDLNFSDLTCAMVNQFHMRYPERKLVTDVHPEIDLYGDALLMKLLISNLLENANKYSSKERPIQLKLEKQEGHIILQVLDEGYGIEEEEKRNVFKKFYRIGNEQTRKTQGTGLGLYLCRKIVEDHNGIITIKNNKPQGSNFTVSFPA